MSTKRPPIPRIVRMTLGWVVLSIAAIAAILGLLARPAAAAILVYASEDPYGAYQGELELDTESPDELEIWIHKGTTSSSNPCTESGTGDRICGFNVLIEVQGPGHISAFLPDSGEVVYNPDTFTSDTRQLRAAFVDVSSSTDPAPVHIGRLTVDATAETGSTTVLVMGENAVAADLKLESIPQDTIAATPVPEPAEILLLASGIAGLALLYRLRRRSLSAG